MPSVRRAVRAVLESIRTAWLILGVTLLMLLLIEGAFRIKKWASTPGPRPASQQNRLAGDPREYAWMPGYREEFWKTWAFSWRPYVYFGRKPSFAGKYVSLDSNGYRVTPQPTTPATPVARVMFLGGSTMWGDFQRDSGTIASVTARRLQPLAGPGQRVEVTNLGESGYVSTQEVIKLILELRAGARPDVVVFYDGINDVASTVQAGTPGIPQNESKRVAEFAMGRTIDPLAYPQGLKKEMQALALLGKHALRQTAMVQWARDIGFGLTPAMIGADSAARGTVHAYVENVRVVEALAAQYGFTPIYVWQPNLHTTPKPLKPFEKNLLARIERDPYNRLLRDVHRAVPPMLDTALARVAPGRFVNASQLFRGDSIAVYTDEIGHNTEASIPRIVDAFWPALERAIQPALARRTLARRDTTAARPSA